LDPGVVRRRTEKMEHKYLFIAVAFEGQDEPLAG
jgi:hypothetical protein